MSRRRAIDVAARHSAAIHARLCATNVQGRQCQCSTMKVTAQACINYKPQGSFQRKSGDKAWFSCIVPQNAGKSQSSHNTSLKAAESVLRKAFPACLKSIGVTKISTVIGRAAAWRFSASLFGRPHCVNTCPCAHPTSSVPISLVCWSVVDSRIYIYRKLCDESHAVEKIDIRCQLLML